MMKTIALKLFHLVVTLWGQQFVRDFILMEVKKKIADDSNTVTNHALYLLDEGLAGRDMTEALKTVAADETGRQIDKHVASIIKRLP